MSERQRLPNRRRTTTFDFELHGLKFTASFSRFADARIAEIFLQSIQQALVAEQFKRT